MAFFSRFLSIFVAPTKVFDDIRDSKVGWWQPWLLVSILMVLATWVMLPLQRVVMEMNPKMTGADLDKQVGIMQVVQLVMAPAMVLIVGFIVSGMSYVTVTLQSKEATFKKYFTLTLFSNIIICLGYLFTAVLLRAKGTENITSPEDLHASLSLRLLAPEDSGAILKGLLGSIEFFTIWGLALIAVGVRRIFGLRTGQALAVVIPLWVLYAVFSIVGEKTGMG